jgi:hypothetical protein
MTTACVPLLPALNGSFSNFRRVGATIVAQDLLTNKQLQDMAERIRKTKIVLPVDMELGGEVATLQKIVVASNIVHPDYMILPFKRYDRTATLKMTEDALYSLHPDFSWPIAVVPQGSTFDEWCKCYESMAAMLRLRAVFISGLDFEIKYNGFYKNIDTLSTVYSVRMEHHLIGFDSYAHMSKALRCMPIKSVSGFMPLACAMADMYGSAVLEDGGCMPELPDDPSLVQPEKLLNSRFTREIGFYVQKAKEWDTYARKNTR